MERLLFVLVILSGLFLIFYSSAGDASILATAGNCMVISQNPDSCSNALPSFCENLMKLKDTWAIPNFMGVLLLLVGFFGTFRKFKKLQK